jgi:hypothetical protein
LIHSDRHRKTIARDGKLSAFNTTSAAPLAFACATDRNQVVVGGLKMDRGRSNGCDLLN